MCSTYWFSTATMAARTRLNITLYVHCLSFKLIGMCSYGLKLAQLASGMNLPTSGDVAWSWGAGFRHVSIFREEEGGMRFFWVFIPKYRTSLSVRLKFRCTRMLLAIFQATISELISLAVHWTSLTKPTFFFCGQYVFIYLWNNSSNFKEVFWTRL